MIVETVCWSLILELSRLHRFTQPAGCYRFVGVQPMWSGAATWVGPLLLVLCEVAFVGIVKCRGLSATVLRIVISVLMYVYNVHELLEQHFHLRVRTARMPQLYSVLGRLNAPSQLLS